jgi:hypothetical protein
VIRSVNFGEPLGASRRVRNELLLENLALPEQLAVLSTRRPQPKLALAEKLFCGDSGQGKRTVLLVQPEPVVD